MTRRANVKGLEMQSTMMTLVRQRGGKASAAAIGLAGLAIMASPASALVTGASNSLQQQLKQRTQGFWDLCP